MLEQNFYLGCTRADCCVTVTVTGIEVPTNTFTSLESVCG